VLDAATVLAIVNGNGPSPVPLVPGALPTLPQWQALNGGASLGFGGFAAENGLTYGGYPYLPADDASFNLFENACVAPAQ